MREILQKFAFSAILSLFLLASCGTETNEPQYTECSNGTNFSKFINYMPFPPEHFSLPDWTALQIREKFLIQSFPQQIDSIRFETEDKILVESIQITPNGSIFFMNQHELYYRNQYGDISASGNDILSTIFDYTNWDGTSFLTDEGYYVYVKREGGSAYSLSMRNSLFDKVLDRNFYNIPYGDCLAGFKEENTLNLIHHCIFLGNPYNRRYRLDLSTNIFQIYDLDIPIEALNKHWKKFQNHGNGTASFEIHTPTTIRRYTIDLLGGPYSFDGEFPQTIKAPDGYYTFENTGAYDALIKKFEVSKFNYSDQLMWTVSINTGDYYFSDTYGWADSTGVFLISKSIFPSSSEPRSNHLYISKDGDLCN